MPATEVTPSLVLALAFLGLTAALMVVPVLYFMWRLMRFQMKQTQGLQTAVLALSRHSAAEGLASVRAAAEAQDEQVPSPTPVRAPRPRAVGE